MASQRSGPQRSLKARICSDSASASATKSSHRCELTLRGRAGDTRFVPSSVTTNDVHCQVSVPFCDSLASCGTERCAEAETLPLRLLVTWLIDSLAQLFFATESEELERIVLYNRYIAIAASRSDPL